MQLKLHMVTIEDLVPEGHFLRRLEQALDLSFVYEETVYLYSRKYGRPPIDPVVLVKYLLVGYLYGIPSERQIEQRIQTDVALRWYLGLDLFDRVPDHSTISQLRRRKPSFRKVFRRLFEEVVRQCVTKGLVSGRLAATDSTHVKANASRASEYLVEMPAEPGIYWERLDAYEEEGLEKLAQKTGKRRKKRTKQIKKGSGRTKKRVSRTDPEAGHMKRPGKPEGPHYLSHQTLDTDHGIILGVTVTPGDVHDSAPYLSHLEQIHRNTIHLQAAAADSAYDFPLAHRELEKLGIDFLSGLSPPRIVLRSSSNAMRSFTTKNTTSISAPTESSCAQRGCTAATAGCSGSIGQTGQSAGIVRCGKNAWGKGHGTEPEDFWTAISSPRSSADGPGSRGQSTGRP